jgi:hypothetical protein
MNNFYVYVWLDPRKPGKYKYGKYRFSFKPFYVGAGKGKRFKNFFDTNARTKKVFNYAKEIRKETKRNPISEILHSNLTKEESFFYEKLIISTIGRQYNNSGVLLNITEGGIGIKGYNHTADTKKKIARKGISNSFYGKKHTLESRIKMSQSQSKREIFGHPCTEETKQKLRLLNLGKKASEETRKKMSESAKIRIEREKKENAYDYRDEVY